MGVTTAEDADVNTMVNNIRNISGASSADKISYDHTNTSLYSTNVQAAINELNTKIDNLIMNISVGTDFSTILHNFEKNETYTTTQNGVLFGRFWVDGGSPTMIIDNIDISSVYVSAYTALDKPFPVCIPVGKGSVIKTGSSGFYPTLYATK